MTAGIGFPDKKVMAELTAKMLLEVEAVRFMTDKPFIFTSGWASPLRTCSPSPPRPTPGPYVGSTAMPCTLLK